VKITVAITIAAPAEAVWRVIEPIERHVEWMEDAVAIEFTSEQTRGVGTTFDCRTRVGPFSFTDQMIVTAWEPGHAMAIAHRGIVGGTGRFTLSPVDGPASHTCFTWAEAIAFPWWLGGPAGARLARPVLAAIWRRNLRRLKTIAEGA